VTQTPPIPEPPQSWRVVLSGGGMRAALASLGVLYALRTVHSAEPITEIVSVSGGSLASAAVNGAPPQSWASGDPDGLKQWVNETTQRMQGNFYSVVGGTSLIAVAIIAYAFKWGRSSWTATPARFFSFLAVGIVWIAASRVNGSAKWAFAVVVALFINNAFDVGQAGSDLIARFAITGLVLQLCCLGVLRWVRMCAGSFVTWGQRQATISIVAFVTAWGLTRTALWYLLGLRFPWWTLLIPITIVVVLFCSLLRSSGAVFSAAVLTFVLTLEPAPTRTTISSALCLAAALTVLELEP
jgi:hypothetical protein